MNLNDGKPLPNYFDRLTDEEKNSYFELRKQLSMPGCKNRRNRSNETFRDIINTIKKFVVEKPDREIDRSLVCGIVWLDNGIAINTHQLSLIINKCKSSINGSFQALGFGTTPTGTESSTELVSKFSFMKKNFQELRQWTVRKKLSETPAIPLKLTELVKKRIEGEENFTAPEEPYKQDENECCLVSFVQNLINKREKKNFVSCEESKETSFPQNSGILNERHSIFDDKIIFPQGDLDSLNLDYFNFNA